MHCCGDPFLSFLLSGLYLLFFWGTVESNIRYSNSISMLNAYGALAYSCNLYCFLPFMCSLTLCVFFDYLMFLNLCIFRSSRSNINV